MFDCEQCLGINFAKQMYDREQCPIASINKVPAMHISNSELPKLRAAMETDTWFKSCPSNLQEFLLSQTEIICLKAGEYLFRNGEDTQGFYGVISGTLQVSIQVEEKVHILMHQNAYEWTGEIAFIDRKPHGADGIAYTDCSVALIPIDKLIGWLDNNPRQWNDFARLLALRFRGGVKLLQYSRFLPLEDQLLKQLYGISLSNGSRERARKRLFVSHDLLAQMLGVRRPSITLALDRLAKRGVIELGYGEVRLLELPKKISDAFTAETLKSQEDSIVA